MRQSEYFFEIYDANARMWHFVAKKMPALSGGLKNIAWRN